MNKKQRSLDENVISNNDGSEINVSGRVQEENIDDEEPIVEDESINSIGTVYTSNLSDWFMDNYKHISSVSNVKVKITHVDPRKNLLMTAPDKNMKERYVWVFRDAHKLHVLNMKPYNMRLFHSNTFQIDYLFDEETKLITYNMKNKLLVFPSMLLEDNIYVPYTKFTVLFENKSVQIPDTDRNEIRNNIRKNADFEFIMSKYKHIRRKKGKVSTNKDVIKELDQRKNKVHDIRHLLTIDLALVGIARQE